MESASSYRHQCSHRFRLAPSWDRNPTFVRIKVSGPPARMASRSSSSLTMNRRFKMLATHEAHTERAVRTTECDICQKPVRVNPLKATEVGVICRMCRCKRCSIPMSSKPCHRCGVAHGTPSAEPGLCERCFESGTPHTVWAGSEEHSVETDSELLH